MDTTSPTEGRTGLRLEHSFNFIGLLAIHGGAVAALFVGARLRDVMICLALYVIRMFAITAGYHRYFSHRSYKTSRPFQLVLAILGITATQKGPLWWAAIHRRHHRESDRPADVHSPVQKGFWQSHMGWVLSPDFERFDASEVKDLHKFPELRFIERHQHVVLAVFIGAVVYFGGMRGICWWYCMSTVLVMHATFAINSLAHVWGRRVYATDDDSRNNALLAILTLGEGWHNNHHRYMSSASQGFLWWQIDISYYVLRALASVGVVWDLKRPPQRIVDEGRRQHHVAVPSFDEVRARLIEATRAHSPSDAE